MYQLPHQCIINKPLYKKAVFEKFNLKQAERDRFDADISRMAIVAYVSPKKIPALAEGQNIKEFYVLQVQLKKREYDTCQHRYSGTYSLFCLFYLLMSYMDSKSVAQAVPQSYIHLVYP